MRGDLGLAKLRDLLNQQISPNLINNEGRTALHLAAIYSTTNTVALLLDNGANPYASDRSHNTAYNYAIINRNIDIAIYLLERTYHGDIPRVFRYDINSRDSNGNTLLNLCLEQGRSDIARLILETYSPNINFLNIHRENALHIAIDYNQTDIAFDLVRRGANINTRNIDGETPNDLAQRRNINLERKAITSEDNQENHLSNLLIFSDDRSIENIDLEDIDFTFITSINNITEIETTLQLDNIILDSPFIEDNENNSTATTKMTDNNENHNSGNFLQLIQYFCCDFIS
jgi:ankyrin repeat protein